MRKVLWRAGILLQSVPAGLSSPVQEGNGLSAVVSSLANGQGQVGFPTGHDGRMEHRGGKKVNTKCIRLKKTFLLIK